MTNIIKTVITLTVLHRADLPLDQMSLAQIGYEIDEGEAVGMYVMESQAALPLARVPAELEALGNDGEFFDLKDGDYADPEPALAPNGGFVENPTESN